MNLLIDSVTATGVLATGITVVALAGAVAYRWGRAVGEAQVRDEWMETYRNDQYHERQRRIDRQLARRQAADEAAR